MFGKRLTAIIRPSTAVGINARGQPTINVAGSEIAIDSYFQILDLASSGKRLDDIVAHMIKFMDLEERESQASYSAMVHHIISNYKLAHGEDLLLGTEPKSDVVTVPGLLAHPRITTGLRRVTTHASSSDPGLRSPTSPERVEELLVSKALKLMTERNQIGKTMPESVAKKRATAAIDLQLRSSLKRHQAVDDAQSKSLSSLEAMIHKTRVHHTTAVPLL